MNEQEIRLRCVELAVDQTRRESQPNFQKNVADLAAWFYSLTIEQPKADPVTEPLKGGRKRDKAPGSLE